MNNVKTPTCFVLVYRNKWLLTFYCFGICLLSSGHLYVDFIIPFSDEWLHTNGRTIHSCAVGSGPKPRRQLRWNRLPISRHPFLQIIVQSTVTKDVELIKWPPSMCVGKRMNTWRVGHCYYFYRWELVVIKQWWRSHNQYKLLMLSVQTQLMTIVKGKVLYNHKSPDLMSQDVAFIKRMICSKY